MSGHSDRAISDSIGVPRSTVKDWRKSEFRYQRKRGSGRPLATDQRQDRAIVRTATRDPGLTSPELVAITNANICARTLRRRLKNMRFNNRKRPSAIFLNDIHRQKRLQWAQNHVLWREPRWRYVVWSDEASICAKQKDGRLKIWMRDGHKVPTDLIVPLCQGGGARLLIWGAIWIGGKSCLFVSRTTMNSERYVELLNDFVLPIKDELGDRMVFMDDNAPPHTSRRTVAHKQEIGLRCMTWPPRSPDLNPIENVWACLKRTVRRRILPHDDVNRLEQLVHQAWDEVPQQLIDDLIRGMNKRIGSVLQHHGGNI